GALNWRVTRTSQSFGNVTCACAGIFVSPCFPRRSFKGRTDHPPPTIGVLFFSFLRSRFLRVLLQSFEQCIEARVVRFPDFSIALEPLVRRFERRGFDSARATLRILPCRDQTGVLEHFEVL